MENKNFLEDMDTYLKDLQSWRLKRQQSEQTIETTKQIGSSNEQAFDEQSMKEA